MGLDHFRRQSASHRPGHRDTRGLVQLQQAREAAIGKQVSHGHRDGLAKGDGACGPLRGELEVRPLDAW